MLARLGLRAGEVAALRLADIDWHGGELTVRGKAGREDRLPLTQEVGEAIAGWLHDGRPRCASAAVFTRVLAPHRGLSDRAVSGVVRQACGPGGSAADGLPPAASHRRDADAAAAWAPPPPRRLRGPDRSDRPRPARCCQPLPRWCCCTLNTTAPRDRRLSLKRCPEKGDCRSRQIRAAP